MKKFLLAMGVAALGILGANATEYTVFDISNPGEWTGDGAGWSRAKDANGFTITTQKVSTTANNLVSPADNKNSWRVYKGTSFTITSESVDMKCVAITYDTFNENQYIGTMNLSDGWTGALTENPYTCTNAAGSKTFTGSAEEKQLRIKKVVVSDEATIAPPTVTEVNSIKEILAVASDSQVKVNFPMTVAFVRYNNVFACDAAGDFIQLYGANEYATGNIIPAGYNATYKLFQGATPELEPVTTFPASTENGTFTPKVVAAADVTTALVNNVIEIDKVEFAAETPSAKENFTGTSDGVTLNFRNNYELASVPAGTYDMLVLVTIYQNAPSIYVISYDAKSAGVAGVTVANGAVKYYNMQGVRIDKPEKGLNIVVKDGKSMKVMF